MLKAFRLSAGRSPKAGRNGRHCGRGFVGRAVYSVVADSDVLPAPCNASAGIRCHVTQVGVLLTDGGIELAFGKLTYPELCYNGNKATFLWNLLTCPKLWTYTVQHFVTVCRSSQCVVNFV